MSKYRKPVQKHRQTQAKSNRLPFLLVLGGIIILIGVLFFAFRKPTAANIPEVTGKPRLKVDKQKVDLGNMKLGSTAFVSFELKNVGDQVLQFTQTPTIQVIEGC
jgi:predicted membrane channel-forming protein YqfA (hemolysin III family)